MIVKKVANPKKSTSKAQRIALLVTYIRSPESAHSQEKCVYAGARGFLMDEPKSQTAEMIAIAQEAVRSKDPINHYVLSWHEGEQPNAEQVEAAVGIFMEELGWADHQAIYGLHADTDNMHLHIVINRVHPDTLKVVEKNRGFDIELAHQAIARIEHQQGWQREPNGRYEVLADGKISRCIPHDIKKPREPGQQKRDMENRTGAKSAQRMAIEQGAAIIEQAQSWAQLHRELAVRGMRYVKTGSGATVFVGDVGVKASDVSRTASLAKVQKRLGVYEQAAQAQPLVKPEPQPLQPEALTLGWRDYIAARQAHYAQKQAAKLEMDQRQTQARQALQAAQKRRREALMEGNWRGKGDLLNALRSVVAAEQAAEKLTLKDEQRQAREAHRQRFRPYPDFEQWLRVQHGAQAGQWWRHRNSVPARVQADEDTNPRNAVPMPRDIRAYVAEVVGRHVHYSRKDPGGQRRPQLRPSFVDTGQSIDIHDWRNEDCTLAALQLSAQKWGRFKVTGSDQYKALCVKLAAEHGFEITNPELREAIGQEKALRQKEVDHGHKTEPEQWPGFSR